MLEQKETDIKIKQEIIQNCIDKIRECIIRDNEDVEDDTDYKSGLYTAIGKLYEFKSNL